MVVFKGKNNWKRKILKRLLIPLTLSVALAPTITLLNKNKKNNNNLQKKIFNESNLFESRSLKSNNEKIINASDIFNIEKGTTTINNLEFDEIIIAPRGKPDNVFISLKNKDNNKLVLSFKKNNQELQKESHLSSDVPTSDNPDKFPRSNYIFLQSVKNKDLMNKEDSKIEKEDLIDSFKDKIIKFNQDDDSSYFSIDENNNNKEFNVEVGTNFLFRGYINSSIDDANALTIFVKAGNKVFSPNSNDEEKGSINYKFDFQDQSTSFETIIGLNQNNKLAISYNTNNDQTTSSVVISNNDKFKKFSTLKAEDALNKIIVGHANDGSDELTWGDILSASWYNYNALLFALTKLKFIASNIDGTITIKVYCPYTIKKTGNGKIQSLSFENVTSPPSLLTLEGFNKGSNLIENNVNGQDLNKYLPQKIIEDDNLYKQLKELVYQQCFGENNLLKEFDYQTDLQLKNPNFNNLTGKIDCNLIVLKNYIDTNGEIITDNTPKDFGIISISNLNKINATSQIGNSIAIPNGSTLTEVNSFDAKDHIQELKSLIYEKIKELLSNIPDSNTANRDISIKDIDFDESNIVETQTRHIKLDKIKIKYYFNSNNGSYANESPFELKDITISGFKETQKTILLNDGSFIIPDQTKNEAENYSISEAEIFLKTQYNNDNLFNIVNKNFNIETDILIDEESWTINSKQGEITFNLKAKNIFDNNGPVSNFINIGKITLTGFKPIVATKLKGKNYPVPQEYQEDEVENITLGQIKTIVSSFYNEDKLFNSESSKFNIATDIDYQEAYLKRINQNGEIQLQIYAKNIYDEDLMISKDYKELGTITLTGFKHIQPTKLIQHDYDVSGSYNEVFADNIANDIENIYRVVLDFYNKKELFNNVASSFKASDDIKIDPETIVANAENGTISFDIWAKNIYNSNFQITNSFNKVGRITFSGFKKRVSTIINSDRQFDISKTDYKQSYVTKVVENQNIFKIFEALSNEKIFKPPLFEHLPKDFDYKKDISIIEEPNINRFKSTITVKFKLNYYLVNGVETRDDGGEKSLTIIGFKELPSTTINGDKIDLNNVTEINIKYTKPIPLDIITTSLKNNLALITTKVNDFWWSPLIDVKQPNNTDADIKFDVTKAKWEIKDKKIILNNVEITGKYFYFNDRAEDINNNKNNLYKITISGFVEKPEENILPIWAIIIISIGATNLALLITWLCIKYYKKSVLKRGKGDKFDDIDKNSNNLSF